MLWTRHRVALLSLVMCTSACWLSHEGGTDAVLCGSAEPALDVSLETVTPSEPCATGPIEGFVVEVDEREDRLDLVLATCPPGSVCDTNRVCRIGVSAGVPGFARAVVTGESLYGFVESPSYLRLARRIDGMHCCFVPGCTCGGETVLYARAGNPRHTPPDGIHEELDLGFALGGMTCGPITVSGRMCGLTELEIEASFADGSTSVTVAPRETGSLGESIRVHNIGALNNTCDDAGPRAAWIAWRAR